VIFPRRLRGWRLPVAERERPHALGVAVDSPALRGEQSERWRAPPREQRSLGSGGAARRNKMRASRTLTGYDDCAGSRIDGAQRAPVATGLHMASARAGSGVSYLVWRASLATCSAGATLDEPPPVVALASPATATWAVAAMMCSASSRARLGANSPPSSTARASRPTSVSSRHAGEALEAGQLGRLTFRSGLEEGLRLGSEQIDKRQVGRHHRRGRHRGPRFGDLLIP
jgi:hypothetical protein